MILQVSAVFTTVWLAGWATMPETTVELIDGVGEFVVAVCLVSTVGGCCIHPHWLHVE